MLLLCGTMTVSAQGNAYRYDETFPFVVITNSEVDALPAFTDEEFAAHSNSVLFQVNKTEIRPDDPFLELYYTRLLPYVNFRHLQLRKIFVRGAASPEGSYENNRRLGAARSNALLTELQRGLRHQYVAIDTETSSVTEDYGYLCLLMRQSNDPDYSVVQRIYDECGGDEPCCKERLMAAQEGRLWQRLNATYFPKLRAARLVLWFSEPDAEHAPEPVVIQPEIVTRRDTVYVNDTIFVRRTVVIDSVFVAQPEQPAVTEAPYICHGRIHIGCIHDRELHPAPADTLLRHPLFALKTNLFLDAATFLNAEIEVPIRRRGSIVAEVVWPWWLQRSHNRWCCEFGSVGLEGRWWFRPWDYHSTYRQWRDSRRAPLTRGFVGFHVGAGYYDFQLPTKYDYPEGLSQYEYYRKGKQGEFVTAGFTLGVARSIGRSLRLEASLGVGAAYTEYRTYHIDSSTDIEPDRDQHLWRDEHEGKYTYLSWLNLHDRHPRSNRSCLWIGPTKANLSLVWLLTKPCRRTKQKGGER